MLCAVENTILRSILSLIIPQWHHKICAIPSIRIPAKGRAVGARKASDDSLATLGSLPPEIHDLIASHLDYPDLLSLKLTNQYFSTLISPKLNVKMRVRWVQDRFARCLPVPKSTKLSFKTDPLFVANSEVKNILKRRRKHAECLDYDKDVQRAFKNPIIALELNRPARYIQIRGSILHSWETGCLVSGNSFCPKIQERDRRKQRFENSLLGRLFASVRRLSWYWWASWGRARRSRW